MITEDLIKQIQSISADTSVSLGERIETVFSMREHEKWNQNIDIYCFSSLIYAIKTEEAISTNAHELLQLYVLLAETYYDQKKYRPLENLSCEVNAILRSVSIGWDVIEETIPRIIDVLEDSVYHHELYHLLQFYLSTAFLNNQLNENSKDKVVKFLKLSILLEDVTYSNKTITKEFQTAISALFELEDLTKIILNPSIGYLKCDPVEYTSKWEEIYYDVEDYLHDQFKSTPTYMGFCFEYWTAKRKYLKEKYDIEWHSPAQMNPGVMFD